VKDSQQENFWYAKTFTLEQRKNWYGEIADVYNRVRPRYPKKLVSRAIDLSQLPSQAAILEVGCGTGTATVEFAEFGFSILCLEPNQEFCRIAKHNCSQYPSVEIRNTLFEEWELEVEKFNAVLMANAIHWIPPEIRYQKTANALQENGSLIVLWNMTPQPQYEVYQLLEPIYQAQAPSIPGYEEKATQQEIVKRFGQDVIDSGLFKNLVSEELACEVTYSIDDYLALLSTLSPYIKLEPHTRSSLFEALREKLLGNWGTSIVISYLSAVHLAQKV
jgi:SAM-dependent methyltransferase